MRKTFAITLFMLATLAWATAQQPGSTAGQSTGQAASPSSQTPGSSPSQGPAAQGPVAAAAVVEGCLGGSNPNYTITNASGTTYKLNIPPTADASKLAAHVGESVNVAGNVNNTGNTGSSIDVQGVGKGTGTCPAGSKTPQK